MEINQEELQKFKQLYEQEYVMAMTDERARAEFSKLSDLFRLVYLTPPSKELRAIARDRAREEEKVLVERYLR